MHQHHRSPTPKTTTRDRRLVTGLSLDEVGRRAGIERSRLSRAERGYIILTASEVARLDRVLHDATAPKKGGA